MRNFTPYLLVLFGLLVALVATFLGFISSSPNPDASILVLIDQVAKAKRYNLFALLGLLACTGGFFWIGQRVLVRRAKKKSNIR